ncbi:hypothetical protein JCM39194_24140 [Desulfotomaculum varum]
MRRKIIYLAGGLLLLVVFSLVKLAGNRPAPETVTVKTGTIVQTVEEFGLVRPAVKHDLYASQPARVVQVPVKNGQSVSQGQTLVIMENLDLAVQIAEARAQLAQATASSAAARAAVERSKLELEDALAQLARTQELFRQGAVARVTLDSHRLQAATARQNLSEQEAMLATLYARQAGLNESLQQLTLKEEQLMVKSPVNGILLELPVKQHQVLNAGDLIAAVAVPEQLEIEVDLLSDDLRQVRLGQPVTVTAPVLGEQVLQGQVKEIHPQALEKESALGITQRRVPVIISLPDAAGLKPGYEVRVVIETGRFFDLPLVPLTAVRTGPDGTKQVMEVVNGRATYRTVQTGPHDSEQIAILHGVSSGSLIIKDGSWQPPD